MVLSRRSYIITALCLLSSVLGKGQETPIGYWHSILPYKTAIGIATDVNTLYTIGREAFFTFLPRTGAPEMTTYSKVEGMSEIGMQCINYDMATSTAVLCYDNGNIDLFKDHTFYNVPDLKNKTIAGDKTVYEVTTINGTAYLSSAQGIIVLDL